MWGAWPRRYKFLLACGLFARYVLPVLVCAFLCGIAACWFYYRVLWPVFH